MRAFIQNKKTNEGVVMDFSLYLFLSAIWVLLLSIAITVINIRKILEKRSSDE